MDHLGLEKNYKLCYSICEKTINAFQNKIKVLDKKIDKLKNKNKNFIFELRLDYLLANDISIDDIIFMINYINREITKKKLLLTIRTKEDGGKVALVPLEYYTYIEKLYNFAKGQGVDIEYKYYIRNKKNFDALFSKNKKDVVMSIHFFDKKITKNYLINLIDNLTDTKCDVVKIAINCIDKVDLFSYFNIFNEYSKKIMTKSKKCIFIIMGVIGRISRILPEWTNTRLVFLTAYNDKDGIGQINYETWLKFRSILEKNQKTW